MRGYRQEGKFPAGIACNSFVFIKNCLNHRAPPAGGGEKNFSFPLLDSGRVRHISPDNGMFGASWIFQPPKNNAPMKKNGTAMPL